MYSTPFKTSKKNSHLWLSQKIGLCLVLLIIALSGFSSFRSKLENSIAASSSIQEKGADGDRLRGNQKSVFYNTMLPNTTSSRDPVGEYSHRDNEAAMFYDTTWPPLRKAMCGEGAPNLMLATTLFRLARVEVFGKDPKGSNAQNKSSTPSKTMSLFFAGEFGASIVKGTNENGKKFVTVYVRIYKCGNNQIRWMENKLFKSLNDTTGEGYTTEQSLSKALGGYLPFQKRNFVEMAPPCIYTAVRDPISHFLSGYNEMEFRQLGEYNNKSSKFGKQARYHLDVPYSSESPELRQKRFRAFVEDILHEDPAFGTSYVYTHFFPMSRVLVILKKYNSELSGYIPELKNITSTWPDFMSSTCNNFPSREVIPTMSKQGQHKSSEDRLGLYKAAKEVWKEAGSISRSLCLLHAFDYACFQDLPDGIPALCRSVYQDYAEEIVSFGTKNYMNYTKRKRKKSGRDSNQRMTD